MVVLPEDPSSTFHYESTCKWVNTLQLSIILKTATSGIPSQANDHLQNCRALQSFSELCENCRVSYHQFLTSEMTDRKLRLGNQCGLCGTNNICTCKHPNIQPILSPVYLCDDSLCPVRFSICQFNPSKFDVTRPFQFSQNSENLCGYLTPIILSFFQHQDKPVFWRQHNRGWKNAWFKKQVNVAGALRLISLSIQCVTACNQKLKSNQSNAFDIWCGAKENLSNDVLCAESPDHLILTKYVYSLSLYKPLSDDLNGECALNTHKGIKGSIIYCTKF